MFIADIGYTNQDVVACAHAIDKLWPNSTIRIYEQQAPWRRRFER